MKHLLLIPFLSGCLSVTHAIVTEKECQPPELVLADVFASSLITTTGIASDETSVVIIGTGALILSTINWIDQMAECHHIH